MKKHTIDARDKKIGRVATEAAHHLLGKGDTDYKPNVVADVNVEIVNAKLLDISPKKIDQKMYKRFSGYPGGLKEEKLSKVIKNKGYEEVLRKAVYGMLPSNKLRALMMKRLIVSE